MTNEEAIKLLKLHEYWAEFSYFDEMAETALKALEKQIPKKPIKANRMIDGVIFEENEYTKCPCCIDYDVQVIHGQKYCHRCGQAIDWSEENG